MKYFDWSEEKNQKLKQERDISFEEALSAIEESNLVDVLEHPNKRRHVRQKIMVIIVNEYAYLVPFVEDENKFFLKTIIPSRKATKKYFLEKERK